MEAVITEAKKGDVLLWLLDGHVIQASRFNKTSHRETLPLPFTITSKPKAVRLQLIRPELKDNLHKGTIAVSNPLYWTSEEVVTNHHIIHYKP